MEIQADLLVELESILKRLDPAEIFPARSRSKLNSAAATLRFWWNTRAGIRTGISSALSGCSAASASWTARAVAPR